MLTMPRCVKVFASAVGLAWASLSFADVPPPPMPAGAPAAPPAASGLPNVNEIFDQQAPQEFVPNAPSSASSAPQYVRRTGCGPNCPCGCQNGSSSGTVLFMQKLREGDFAGIFWNPDGEPFNAWDAISSRRGIDPAIRFGGWYQTGYHNKNNLNGTGPISAGSFNNHAHRINLHQAWVWFEKAADGSEGLDWGFRADLMYGVDGADTQAFGNTPGSWDFANGWNFGQYAWAMPQLYGELAYGDFSVIFGHFFTPIGYEVVPAPNNFFYSHSFTNYNSEPFTHTGALATYNATENITLYGGYTLGWDTGFDRRAGGSNFLGGISLALTDDISFTYMTTIGDFGARSAGPIGLLEDANGYMHSIVIDVQLTDNLEYVFQSDFMNNEINIAGARTDDYQIGINQYLFYTINSWLAAGVRAEWWRARPVFSPGPGSGLDPVSLYETTFGLNIKPNPNLTIRPEMRYQWSPRLNTLAPQFFDEWFFGIDAVWRF